MRIYYLPVEYWTKEIISSIENSVGVPIKVDGATADEDVGHFARVLVEVDLALPLPDSVHVDCPDQSFYVEIGFEQLPHFCTKCKITGHSLDNCFKHSAGKMIEQPEKPKEGDVVDAAIEKSKGGEDFQFRKPKSTWHPKPGKETKKATKNRFNVLSSQDISGPDILEVVTIPIYEDEVQQIKQGNTSTELIPEEEEDQVIELEKDEQQINDPTGR
ncbi:uncharacterized protein LOC131004767 [Salvia miltiorrhiza]|uniref:uncharacterized protein LOC131004767 n=1 Tax=Salvia miltiorrhiza TaxID=226208 RepID=UPI0025AD9737|nr:uncharacterized protein LOC131004767 [Salvia miltiorrhiza]